MASIPSSLSAANLMTLGMFLFGMDQMAYSEMQRRKTWRHEKSERFMARAASQFVGPGDDTITLPGTLVPEAAGTFSAIETLIAMADTGDDYPLVDGLGRVLGHYRIVSIDQTHRAIMAGGIPRVIDFSIELDRAD